MNPKCIVIKSQSKDFYKALLYKLEEFKSIRYFNLKVNGFYTIVIKCHSYYDSIKNCHINKYKRFHDFDCKKIFYDKENLYGSYIFLYSVVSIILAELFITYYEHSVSNRIIHSKKDKKINLNKLSSISSLLLDESSPFELSSILYKKRKNFLLDATLKNFRKRNFIFIDNFIDFFAKDYICELKKIIDASIEILDNKLLYNYIMTFIFAHGDVT